MSKQRILEEFLSGKLDRRTASAKLVALGVSSAAAAAYVSAMTPISALAGPASPGGGGIVRYQETPGEDYGTTFSFETPEEAIGLLLDEIAVVQSILSSLDLFDSSDFDDGVFEALSTIREQQGEHADALAALADLALPDDLDPVPFDSPEELLVALADALDQLVALYAAVAPAIGDGADRQTITEAAIAVGGHRAVVRLLAGLDPSPDAFPPAAI